MEEEDVMLKKLWGVFNYGFCREKEKPLLYSHSSTDAASQIG
jgi:hypothetical protein